MKHEIMIQTTQQHNKKQSSNTVGICICCTNSNSCRSIPMIALICCNIIFALLLTLMSCNDRIRVFVKADNIQEGINTIKYDNDHHHPKQLLSLQTHKRNNNSRHSTSHDHRILKNNMTSTAEHYYQQQYQYYDQRILQDQEQSEQPEQEQQSRKHQIQQLLQTQLKQLELKQLGQQQQQQQPNQQQMKIVTTSQQFTKKGPIIQPIIGPNFYTNHSYYHDIIPEGTKLLTKEEIAQINIECPDLTAIIHIGPMKTGSSSIQASFREILNVNDPIIDSDNYISITQYTNTFYNTPGHGVWNLIGCFRDPRAPTNNLLICLPEMLPRIHDLASKTNPHNIIISAEYLTSPATNIAALKEFLLPWNKHRIIAYYRRYYDWINSFHNQATKKVTTPYRKKLTEFLHNEANNKMWFDRMYLTEPIKRWKEYFDDIEVLNAYETTDVRDSFYCNALINATNTCNKLRIKKESNTPMNDRPNPSVAFIYEDLAYYAKEMNLWSETSLSSNNIPLTIQDVSIKIKYYQEKVLNLNKYDFGIAKECPSPEVSDYFLQQTLDTEKSLFPKYYKEKGEKEIRTEFALHIQTKLCHINPLTVLQQDNNNGTIWNHFFKDILPSM